MNQWSAKARKQMLLCSLLCLAAFGCRMPIDSNRPDDRMVALGRDLFFDQNLSVNRTRSCGTCHNPDFAFTDGYKRSLGAYADLHQRNATSLFNLGEQLYLTSADSTLHDVYDQMEQPLFHRTPIEMGADVGHPIVFNRILQDPTYLSALNSVRMASVLMGR
jgi:cytochrome c peroxidase